MNYYIMKGGGGGGGFGKLPKNAHAGATEVEAYVEQIEWKNFTDENSNT